MNNVENRDANSDSQSAASRDPEQIEADIARHRQELSHTVDELTDRLDVKKQAQQKFASVQARATDRAETAKIRAQNAEPRELAAMAAPVLATVAAIALAIGLVRRLRQ
ncbi:DUF3618 domain-containing protein [Ornithinimicrobium sp. Arc0846-15]|nr:DUF3618 domain-containing protein [Ornithinimicrobium laminariae]